MKFRFAFSISKTERKLRLRFWKWDVWRFDSNAEQKEVADIVGDSSKAGFLSFKKKDSPAEKSESELNKLLFQALFYPNVESRIWRVVQKLIRWVWNFFSVRLEKVEVRGTLGDPFYDSIALGMSGGSYCPEWESENGNWSAKGEVVLKTRFYRLFFFVFGIIYEVAILVFILWRGTRLAKKNPNGENMSEIRKWIFLKSREAV
ncbi:MAG: hypothetical protein LBB36_04970 [Fibromonadaceae bacterium]|jgi:hypothetical protein|nr:hypothetical protein [Fibromonadaceae bacterium]